MAEFIGNFPLALMLIPITTGLLLGAYIASYFFRRRKKSKMKLGFHSSSSTEETDTLPVNEAAAEEVNEVEEEVNTDLLPPSPEPPAVSPPDANPLTLEDKLDLGILSKTQEPSTAEPPAQEKQETVNLSASPPETTPMVTQTINSSEDYVELLRLLRDPQTGQLVVEVAQQRYIKLADVTDKKIGQYILKITAHLLAFTNGVIVTDAGMKSVYRPKLGQAPNAITASSPQPTAPAPPEKVSDAPTPTPPQPAPISSVDDSVTPLDPPTSSPTSKQGGLLNRVAQPPPPPSSLTPLNLAEEIDEIVQARLRYSPLAADTFIKITSDFSGGIRINVNGTHYNSPDEIPDQQARELIQASIKEWEHS